MRVKLLTGKKAGKIADVTHEHGRALVDAGKAIEVGESGEVWPEKKEKPAEPTVVVQPIIVQEEKKPVNKRAARRRRNNPNT